jgi:DNA polymerase III delta prime subunit
MSEFLWVEAYRPKKISECVLPDNLKETFQEFVNKKNVPNLLLTGGPGVGKTTVAKAMLEEVDADYIVINGSMNGNIDTLRNEIMQFASTVSFTGGRKYVILDEADYLNPNSTQPALRNFMEEFSNNCGFILTCNFKNRIISPLHSRCSVVDFNIPKDQKMKLASQFLNRVCSILVNEDIDFDKKAVAEFITRHFPDWRRVINELQRYSATGRIDSGILSNTSDSSIKELVNHLKAKSFTEMRKWVAENNDIDSTALFRKLYDMSTCYLEPRSIPQLVLLLADYQHKAAFVADHEINMVACFTEVMTSCEFTK